MGKILEKQLSIIKQNNYKKENYHSLGKLVIWEVLDKLIKEDNYSYYHYPNTIDGTRNKQGDWVTNKIIFSNDRIDYDELPNI